MWNSSISDILDSIKYIIKSVSPLFTFLMWLLENFDLCKCPIFLALIVFASPFLVEVTVVQAVTPRSRTFRGLGFLTYSPWHLGYSVILISTVSWCIANGTHANWLQTTVSSGHKFGSNLGSLVRFRLAVDWTSVIWGHGCSSGSASVFAQAIRSKSISSWWEENEALLLEWT